MEDPYLEIIKILQKNAKEESIDIKMVKEIYDMEKSTTNYSIKVDEDSFRQKVLKGMEK